MMYAEEIKCKNVPEYLARSYRADGSTENEYKTHSFLILQRKLENGLRG